VIESLDSLPAGSDEANQATYQFVSLFLSLDQHIHSFLLSSGHYRRISECLSEANTPTEVNLIMLAITNFAQVASIAIPPELFELSLRKCMSFHDPLDLEFHPLLSTVLSFILTILPSQSPSNFFFEFLEFIVRSVTWAPMETVNKIFQLFISLRSLKIQVDIARSLLLLLERGPRPISGGVIEIFAFVWNGWPECFDGLSSETLRTLVDESRLALSILIRSEGLQTSFSRLLSLYFILSLTRESLPAPGDRIPLDQSVLAQIYSITQSEGFQLKMIAGKLFLRIIIALPHMAISGSPPDVLLDQIDQILNMFLESSDEGGISLGFSVMYEILEFLQVSGISDISAMTSNLTSLGSTHRFEPASI
jgi:hypothetical protein